MSKKKTLRSGVKPIPKPKLTGSVKGTNNRLSELVGIRNKGRDKNPKPTRTISGTSAPLDVSSIKKDPVKAVQNLGERLTSPDKIKPRSPQNIPTEKTTQKVDKSGGKTTLKRESRPIPDTLPDTSATLASNLNMGMTQEPEVYESLNEKVYDPKKYFQDSGGLNPLAGMFNMTQQDNKAFRDRSSKIALFNSIGQGLRTIVDSQFPGATKTPYNSDYWDKYMKDLDKADTRDYNLNQQMLQEAIRKIGRGETWNREDAVRAEGREFSREMAGDQREFTKEMKTDTQDFSKEMAGDQRKFTEGQTDKAQVFQTGRDKLQAKGAMDRLREGSKLSKAEWEARYDRMEGLERVKNTYDIRKDLNKPVLTLYEPDSKGGMKPVADLTESQVERVMGWILNAPEAKDDIELMRPTLGDPMSKATKRLLVEKHWHLVRDKIFGSNEGSQQSGSSNPYAYTGSSGQRPNPNKAVLESVFQQIMNDNSLSEGEKQNKINDLSSR